MVGLTTAGFSQKIVKNEVDRFTKEQRIVTSKEKIWRNVALGGLIDVYVEKNDGRYLLWLVRHEREIFSVTKGDLLYISLENGESVRLECQSITIADKGENLWHGNAAYLVTEEAFKMLTSTGATGIRIDQTTDYVTKEIKEKFKDVISNSLKLVK